MAEERLTHKTVSERSGISDSRVGEYVRGQGNPTYTTLLKLAEDGLHVSLPALALRAHKLRMQAKRLEGSACSRPHMGRSSNA
jgi:transcriptional regulator with XRE-family HTH domain